MYIPRLQTIAALKNVGSTIQDLGSIASAEKERQSKSVLAGKEFDVRAEQIRSQNEERILGAKSMLARNEQDVLRTKLATKKAEEDAARRGGLDQIAEEDRKAKAQEKARQDETGTVGSFRRRELMLSGKSAQEADATIKREAESDPFIAEMYNEPTTFGDLKTYAAARIGRLKEKYPVKFKEYDDYEEIDKLAARMSTGDGVPETDEKAQQAVWFAEQKGMVLYPMKSDTGRFQKVSFTDQEGVVHESQKPIIGTRWIAMKKDVFDKKEQEIIQDTIQSLELELPASENRGRISTDQESGMRFQSDGTKWNIVKD